MCYLNTHFLLNYICLHKLYTRIERLQNDPLAAVSNIFDLCISDIYNCKAGYIVIFIFSAHHTPNLDLETGKPLVNIDYNKTKKGQVDEEDKKYSN